MTVRAARAAATIVPPVAPEPARPAPDIALQTDIAQGHAMQRRPARRVANAAAAAVRTTGAPEIGKRNRRPRPSSLIAEPS